jgi:hypothetical protein
VRRKPTELPRRDRDILSDSGDIHAWPFFPFGKWIRVDDNDVPKGMEAQVPLNKLACILIRDEEVKNIRCDAEYSVACGLMHGG